MYQDIKKTEDYAELRKIGKMLYEGKFPKEERDALFEIYRDKVTELELKYLDNPRSVFTEILNAIKDMVNKKRTEIAKLGKDLYDRSTAGEFLSVERELLWRAYKKQKSKLATAGGNHA